MNGGAAVEDREVAVRAGGVILPGNLAVPPGASALVLFVHGSGSSRFSARNRYVARVLQEAGLATLLFDLLTEEEHEVDSVTREYRFDIPMLGERTVATVDWLASAPQTAGLGLGLFGASTGSAAALIAAAERPDAVGAVVSRGGRPDLAMAHLDRVRAPTLFIVGALDTRVIELNAAAAAQLCCAQHTAIVPGASHLFEEPGTLERAAGLARDWFLARLPS